SRTLDFDKALLQTIPFGMDIVDEKGNVLFINKNFEASFGKDAVGKKCWHLYKDDRKQCPFCPLKEGVDVGKTRSIEVDGVAGGKSFLITHTGMNYSGKKAVLEIFQDITLRRRAEESLLETVKMKSDFVSMVSHELRTPLTVINESIDFVLRGKDEPLPGDRMRFLKMAEKNARRMSRLVTGVLDFQKLDAGKEQFRIRRNDINALIREVRDMLRGAAEKKGLKINLSLGRDVDKVKFDRDKILQVMTNLVNNAVKFTKKGDIQIATKKEKDFIVVSVCDTGIGIRKSDRHKVFQAFEQIDRTEGTGLGLVISKEIIGRHHGRIWVESVKGKGSKFHFVLPVK
ncbi:MAG: PAS domain-containing sensor histidine kinase, partial [Candidatus Omnitrophica bacterium]|nr:PAS domain-containing sensor histidine kinase [Candidatus Omnitrophota bacterium]